MGTKERTMENKFRGTTILALKRKGKTVIGGDGQVTLGNTVIKGNAQKVRRLYKDQIIAGFAGATSDAFTLFSKFEAKLDEYRGNLKRAAVELSKDWRLDKYLRRLEALLLVADKETIFLISGTGDLIEPEDDVIAIGSGGPYALAAARALMRNTDFDAEEIVKKSLQIAAEICIYTNENIVLEVL